MAIEMHGWVVDKRPITAEELAGQAMRANKMCVVAIRDHVDWGNFALVESGALADGDLILGWMPEGPDDPDSVAIRKDLAGKKQKDIERWYKKEIICTTLLMVLEAPDWQDEDERSELVEAYGDDYASFRDSCRVQYVTRTTMGRSESDVALQILTLDWILQLRGGMFEEPQEGTYEVRSAAAAG